MNIRINGETVAAAEGESLMTVLVRTGRDVSNVCNGQGTCGKCKVQIMSAVPAPLEVEQQKLSAEELASGVRLACLVKPCDGMTVICSAAGSVERKGDLLFLPQESGSRNSGLRRITVSVERPTLDDERGDWERLLDRLQEQYQLEQLRIGLQQLQALPCILRQADFTVTVALWHNQILDIRAGIWTEPIYGAAIDIGTTNIAVALYDLETGCMSGLAAAGNGQAIFGADVISRIEFANRSQHNRDRLRQAVTDTMNSLLSTICLEAKINRNDILKAVIVGNTTMHHLFLGIDVSYLALSPFVAACTADLELEAAEAGLRQHPCGRVILFPNVGGFVGGDTLGAVLGAEHLLERGRHLLIDIGTNCELYLQDGERMWACSTAAGPAFEGAGIACGMRAQPGAIERVTITGQEVSLTVIGGREAAGICGSGLIEAVEQMRKAGIITPQGRLVDPLAPKTRAMLAPELASRIREGGKFREFVLHFSPTGKDIVLTQQDISQLQLAKGAVSAGIKTLLKLAGLTADELDSVILAGTFAAHLNLASTVEIGLIPCLDINKLLAAGNAAHAGAVKVLLDQQAFEGLRKKSRSIVHVELGGSPIFNRYYMDSMFIEPCHM